MDISQDRIKAIIDALGLTAGGFAQSVGISPTTVYGLVNGTRKPGYDTLIELCKAEPRINADYLLRGVGNPLNDQTAQKPVAPTVSVQTSVETSIDLIDKWKQLQRAINRTIDQELLAVGLTGGPGQLRSGQTEKAEPQSDYVSLVGPKDAIELTILKQMIDSFAQLQRTYSIGYDQQIDLTKHKFEGEWIPNPDNALLGRVVAARMVLDSVSTPERFIRAHRLYSMEILYFRNNRFIPSGKEFDEWRLVLESQPNLFMNDRLSHAKKSVNYFLTKADNYALARHYIALVDKLR